MIGVEILVGSNMANPLIEITVTAPVPASRRRQVPERQRQAIEHLVRVVLQRLPLSEIEAVARYLEKALTLSASAAQEVRPPGGQPLSDKERRQLEFTSLMRYFTWRRELLRDALTAQQVADLLHTSRQTPHDRRKAGTLLAVLDNGAWRFPAWQFDPQGPDGVIDGLPEVLRALQVPLLAQVSWLTKTNPVLDGVTPVEALRRGQKEWVLEEAAGVGEP